MSHLNRDVAGSGWDSEKEDGEEEANDERQTLGGAKKKSVRSFLGLFDHQGDSDRSDQQAYEREEP